MPALTGFEKISQRRLAVGVGQAQEAVVVIQVPLPGVGDAGRRHLIQPPVQHHQPRSAQHGQMRETSPGDCPMILAISLTMRGSPSLNALRMAQRTGTPSALTMVSNRISGGLGGFGGLVVEFMCFN